MELHVGIKSCYLKILKYTTLDYSCCGEYKYRKYGLTLA